MQAWPAKRFLLFTWKIGNCHPEPGWGTFHSSHDEFHLAVTAAKAYAAGHYTCRDWCYQIIDTQTGEILQEWDTFEPEFYDDESDDCA
jgi:hypothetical protein